MYPAFVLTRSVRVHLQMPWMAKAWCWVQLLQSDLRGNRSSTMVPGYSLVQFGLWFEDQPLQLLI